MYYNFRIIYTCEWMRKKNLLNGRKGNSDIVNDSIDSYLCNDLFSYPEINMWGERKRMFKLLVGSEDGNKKMHWKSWKLCNQKCMGWMCFRHLEKFNKALLAKQICRIIYHPHSLMARVLKEIYFRCQDIMEATLGNNLSYIWRSILWSRPTLEKGIY